MNTATDITNDETVDFLNDDFSETIDELEKLSESDILKIEINEGLEEALKELDSLHDQFSKKDSEKLLDLCKATVIETITGQFGLASLVIESKDGGNVTTAHNFKKGIVASDADKDKYDKYVHQNYQETRKNVYNPIHAQERLKYQPDSEGMVPDDYTGKEILFKDANLDHIVPIKEVEDSSAKAHLAMSVEERAKLMCNKQNYAITSESANKAKGAKPMEKFVETDKAKELGIDKNVAMQKDAAARKYVYRTLDNKLIKKYVVELGRTGLKDAGNMAAYSALGVIMRDITQAVFDEIRTIFRNRGNETAKEIFIRFKEHMAVVFENIKAEWKDILKGSFEAGLMAFLSSLVVFIINLFATTLKKMVMMIRAGFVSICQAVKMLAHPPEGMDREEANYQALKILTAGIIGAASLGLSVAIDSFLMAIPGLQPLMGFPVPIIGRRVSEILATTMSALLGGLLATIAIYLMDKCRDASKKDKLQIQLITQSGVVLQFKRAQSWLVLRDAYRFIANEMIDEYNEHKAIEEKICEDHKRTDEALDDFHDFVDKI